MGSKGVSTAKIKAAAKPSSRREDALTKLPWRVFEGSALKVFGGVGGETPKVLCPQIGTSNTLSRRMKVAVAVAARISPRLSRASAVMLTSVRPSEVILT